MQSMKRLLTGTIAAVASYVVTRRLTKQAPQPANITWISADSDESDSGEKLRAILAEADNDEPMYNVGDTVVTINPFTYEFSIVDLDDTPLYYVVQEVKYDHDERTYRYQLDGENEWYAEDWLYYPPYPAMSRELIEEKDADGDETDISKSERNLQGAILDEQAQKKQVDDLLDRLALAIDSGADAEILECKRQLREVTK